MSQRWYGSLHNRLHENGHNAPSEELVKVGTGVTEMMWSDRHAYFIVGTSESKTADGWHKEIIIARAKVKCKNYYAGDWEVEFDPEGHRQTIKVTRPFKNGGRAYTSDGTHSGTHFVLGFAEEYEDPSF